MSFVGRATKKVFKVVRKAAPYILAAGALVFTAGAAFPALGIGTGGWAGVGTAISKAVGGGVLGGALGGALTYAGYGALAGGTIAAISGKNIGKGLSKGALTGALIGGAAGAVGAMGGPALPGTPAASAASETAATASQGMMPAGSSISSTPLAAPGASAAPIAGGAPYPAFTSAASPALSSPLGGTSLAAPATGGMLPSTVPAVVGTTGTGLTGNSALMGAALASPVIGGLVQGVGAGMAAKADADSETAKQERIADNYRTGMAGLMTPEQAQGMASRQQPLPRPADRFAVSPRGMWVHNPGTGRIDFVRGDA